MDLAEMKLVAENSRTLYEMRDALNCAIEQLSTVEGERDQAMERIEDAIQKFGLMSKGRYTHWEKSQIARRVSASLSDFIARAALHPATEAPE